MIKVNNLVNDVTKKMVNNQFVITDTDMDRIIFQSYDETIIVVDKINKVVKVNIENYNCSKTTAKYRNQFFEKIGLYNLANKNALDKAIEKKTTVIDGYTYEVVSM